MAKQIQWQNRLSSIPLSHLHHLPLPPPRPPPPRPPPKQYFFNNNNKWWMCENRSFIKAHTNYRLHFFLHLHICLHLLHLPVLPAPPALGWQPGYLKQLQKSWSWSWGDKMAYTCLASVRTDIRSRAWWNKFDDSELYTNVTQYSHRKGFPRKFFSEKFCSRNIFPSKFCTRKIFLQTFSPESCLQCFAAESNFLKCFAAESFWG